jgi:hypothetical protein
LPQELRIRGITEPGEANRFLNRHYIREFNRKFTVQAAEPDASAFVACTRSDLDRIFSIQTERVVNRDNTVQYNNVILQIDRQSWRRSMDGCRVTIYHHLNGVITIGYGAQELGRYAADGRRLNVAASLRRDLKSKRLAAPLPNRQTGHLMC